MSGPHHDEATADTTVPAAARLRARLADDELIVVPGCTDALGARLIERAGFEAAYLTGFGASATLLGRPDVGLLTGSEMLDAARRIASATTLPVIADADTGYGNALNVQRTVVDLARAGVAGIQLEDQVAPKRCGHLAGKAVIDADEAVAKVRAAVEASIEAGRVTGTGVGPVIVARTDARATDGLDAAITRAHRFADAGADVLFVEALVDVDELARVGAQDFGRPLLFNWVEGGRTPPLSADEVASLGYRVLLAPITLVLAAAEAMEAALASLASRRGPDPDVVGTVAPIAPGRDRFVEFTDRVGLPETLARQARLAADVAVEGDLER